MSKIASANVSPEPETTPESAPKTELPALQTHSETDLRSEQNAAQKTTSATGAEERLKPIQKADPGSNPAPYLESYLRNHPEANPETRSETHPETHPETSLFGDEQQPSLEEIQNAGWAAVREGLVWAVGQKPVPSEDEKKWLAILESMRRLAPGSSGPVSEVEIWGPVIGTWQKRIKLDKDSAKRIRSSLTKLRMRHEVKLRVFTGRVRELDLDKLSLILRDTDHEEGDVQLALDDEQLLATAREAHYQELRVRVAARSEDQKLWTATEIEFVKTSDTDQGNDTD